jgi:hypothetical protein
LNYAPVAQLDRAAASGAVGREFESLRARHFNSCIAAEATLKRLVRLFPAEFVVQLTSVTSHPNTRPKEYGIMQAKSNGSEVTNRARNILPDIIFISMILISVVGLFYSFVQQ